MVSVIYSVETGEVVADAEDVGVLRPRLESLRAEGPGGHVVGKGGTRAEALLDAAANAGRFVVARETERAALRALPPVRGEAEIRKSEWDAAMGELSSRLRGRAANLAAHGWAIRRIRGGLRLVATPTAAFEFVGDVETRIDGDRCCQTCEMTGRYLGVRGSDRPLRCALGRAGPMRQGLRDVGRIQDCEGYRRRA